MDLRIFQPEPMGLKDELLSLPLEDRLTYNPDENIFFVNFENLYIKSSGDIKKIKAIIDKTLHPLGKKVFTIVNYDNFNIYPDLVDEYAELVKYVMKYYENVTRYTSSAFLQMKLGEELEKRGIKASMYKRHSEAQKELLKK